MPQKKVTILDYANHFGLVRIHGDMIAMSREITEISVNRPGLELAGFFDYPRSHRLVFLGNKEITYIQTMSETAMRKSFDFLTSDTCPGIVICQGRDCPKILLEIAKKKNFPLLATSRATNMFNLETVMYLQEALAPMQSIHGALLEIYSMGVLILGDSGIGKSETALELVKKGHRLISDDRVDISYVQGRLYGEAPELLIGMMEVRGIGIIDISRMFGINSLMNRIDIHYAIQLVKPDLAKPIERLGTTKNYFELFNQKIPLLKIPVFAGRSIAEIIETAVTYLKLKDYGYDSSYEFEVRMKELLARKKGDKK